MKTSPARVNRRIFEQVRFDSGALGIMTSVVHKFPEAGVYQVVVRHAGQRKGEFTFRVDKDSGVKQLSLDLAKLASISGPKPNTESCDCANSIKSVDSHVVAPDGYVLFYASSGENGYSVQAGRTDAKGPSFDSEQLTDGDLFALSLFEPTDYSMTDRIGGARGIIQVTFSTTDAKRLKTLETIYVDANGGNFNPSQVALVASQGLVFRIRQRSRIVVEKAASIDQPRQSPLSSWKKLTTLESDRERQKKGA